MAGLAKLIGIVSLIASAGVGLLAFVALVSPTSTTDEAAMDAFLFAVVLGSLALLLAGVGAVAYAVGEMSEAAEAERQRRARRMAERT
jgi:hypothetical protein